MDTMDTTIDGVNGEGGRRQYELALLLKSEDDAPAMATLVRQHNGEITAEPRAKRLALAYKIKGNTEAAFVTCFFRASGEDVKQLEHDLRTRPGVIRSMVLRATTAGALPVAAAPAVLPERPGSGPGRGGFPRASAPRETRKAPPPAPLSNEALENLLKEI